MLGANPTRPRGFTLLELMTVIVIIAILVTLAVPIYKHVIDAARRGSCLTNLRSLFTGALCYVQEQNHWPQIASRDTRSKAYAEAWRSALRPYGISNQIWICPSVQSNSGNPEFQESDVRVDYFATPFDSKPQTPFKWPEMPWFMERGDVHGDGQLIIFTNGQTKSLKEVAQSGGQPRSL